LPFLDDSALLTHSPSSTLAIFFASYSYLVG
jgi:hypothetical protein